MTEQNLDATADDIDDLDIDRNPVEQLADEFAMRHRKGECPSVAEYVKRFPQFTDEIEALFPSVAMMEQLKRREDAELHVIDRKNQLAGKLIERIGDFEIVREVGRGGMGVVYEAVQESLGRRVALKVLTANSMSSPKQLQRFKRESQSAAKLHHTNIVPVFGVGEFEGMHYYVMQFIEGLGLDIVLQALKQWHSLSDNSTVAKQQTVDEGGNDALSGRSFSAWIAIEALQRDGFSHSKKNVQRPDPSVSLSDNSGTRTKFDGIGPLPTAPPFSLGPDDDTQQQLRKSDLPGPPEAVEPAFVADEPSAGTGANLTESTRFETGYWRSVARLGVQIAEALDYAHTEGVIHRDIKPGNLLLDPHGTVWITDFGLAKQAEYDNLTNTGDIVGTLRYMAPEQFDGISDERSDIYSLGLTLYELVCLRPAFDGNHRQQLMQQVTTQSPPQPRSIRSDIPRDLETIILKAMQSEPTKRYKSGADLAEDLERFLEDRPILARRSNAVERVWRWSKRNPAAAISSSLVVVLLVAITLIASTAYWKTNQALERATKNRTEADTARLVAEQESQRARQEFNRADRNLDIALAALEEMFGNVSSRGVPSSVEMELEDEDAPQFEAILTDVDAQLLKGLLGFYELFSQENKDNLELRSLTARAFRRVGDLNMRLNEISKAEEAYKKAISYCDRNTYPLHYAEMRNALGNVYRLQLIKQRSAQREYRAAEAHLMAQPDHIRQSDAGQFQLAQTYYLQIRRTPGERASRPPGAGRSRGGGRGRPAPASPPTRTGRGQGPPQSQQQGPTEGPPQSQQQGQTRNRDSRGQPSNARRNAGGPNRPTGWGGSWQRDREDTMLKGLAIIDRLVAATPQNTQYGLLRARLLKERVESRVIYDSDTSFSAELISYLNGLVTEFPADPRFKYELADVLAFSGRELDRLGDDLALSLLEESVDICRSLVNEFPTAFEYRTLCCSTLTKLARVQLAHGDEPSAFETYEEAIQQHQDLTEKWENSRFNRFLLGKTQMEYAIHLKHLERLTDSERIHFDAIKTLKGAQSKMMLRGAYESLSEIYDRTGDKQKAQKAREDGKSETGESRYFWTDDQFLGRNRFGQRSPSPRNRPPRETNRSP